MKQIVCFESHGKVFERKSQALANDCVEFARTFDVKLREKRDNAHPANSFSQVFQSLMVLAEHYDDFQQDLRYLGRLIRSAKEAETEEGTEEHE